MVSSYGGTVTENTTTGSCYQIKFIEHGDRLGERFDHGRNNLLL